MQQKIQQFVFLSERILSESGELRLRRTWKELSAISFQLAPYMVQLSQNFDPKYALLFLLSCGNEGNQKNGLFSMVFRKILLRLPSNDLLSLLSSVSRVELNTYLLPFLYEKGDIGSVATYVAAKLGLKVQTDSIEFFLSSREWSQEDLINLSFLVLIDEKDLLIKNLNSAYNSSSKEIYSQFINVLNSSSIIEPLIPNLQELESIVNKQSSTVKQTPKPVKNNNIVSQLSSNQNYKFKLTGLNNQSQTQQNNISLNLKQNQNQTQVLPTQQNNIQQNYNNNQINNNNKNIQTAVPISTNNVTTPQQHNTINNKSSDQKDSSKKTDNSNNNNTSTNNQKLDEILENIKDKLSNVTITLPDKDFFKKPIFIAPVVIVLILILYFALPSFNSQSENITTEVVPAPPKEGKLPDYWIDAVTNKKITPKYMAADVDYRMGELYLTRNMYAEAIKFFESSLSIEPNHYLAKLRLGYSELMQGNYFVAEQLFNELLKKDSRLQNLNLYIAKNYYAQNKYDKAKKYYLEEYRLYNSLAVGMEYANFLAKIGEENNAMSFLATLQNKFPDKMLVLDTQSSDSKSNKKQIKKK